LTFLSPIPAIIAAALAVPVLVVYYLLKLRRRPVRVSSTVLWMQAVRDVQVNIPFRWLRPTWLFILQLAVLSLLLLAMARPALDAHGDTPARVILLIDRTASMAAVDDPGGPTRLERAQQEAIRTLDELSRSTGTGWSAWGALSGLGRGGTPASVAVIAYAVEPFALTSFTTDRARIRAAIESMTPSDQPGASGGQAETSASARGLQAAFDLASAMLAGDVEEEGPRQRGLVILFSDGVSALRQDGQSGYSLAGEFRFVQVGPQPGEPVDNLGIVALAARRDWEDPAMVRIFVQLVNAGERAITAPLALQVDNREVQRTAVEIPGRADGQDEGEAPDDAPGQTAANFQLDLRDGGIVTVQIAREDALRRDNEASIVIDPARRPRILLVTPDAPPAPEGEPVARRGPEWFITELLREMRLPLRTVPASVYMRDAAAGIAPSADLVIFDRVMPERLPPVPTMSFGASLPLDAIQVEPPEAGARGTYFTSWQRTHSILRHVALDSIYTARPMRVRIAPPDPAAPRLQVTELARGTDGPLIVHIDDRGVPRLLVAFELIQSNWPVHPGFTIFMAAAIDHLTLRGESAAGRAFTTAEPASILAPPGLSRLTLEGPRRFTVEAPPATGASPRRINLGLIDTAGIYRIAGATQTDGPAAIAVNLASPIESGLRSRSEIRVAGETYSARAGAAAPREIWHWFILAALGLLCIEWLINARQMRV
jgi:hypothetical protein